MSYTDQISRIQPSTTTQIAPAQKSAAVAAEAKPTTKSTAAAASAPTDRADISATSKAVAAALKTSDVRLDKVAHLQAAIANGSYKVSSVDVASKLLDTLTVR